MFAKPYRWCLPIFMVALSLSIHAQSDEVNIAPPASDQSEVTVPLHRQIWQTNRKLNRFLRRKDKKKAYPSISLQPRHFLARNRKMHRNRSQTSRVLTRPNYPNWSPSKRNWFRVIGIWFAKLLLFLSVVPKTANHHQLAPVQDHHL